MDGASYDLRHLAASVVQAVLFTETKVSEAIKWDEFCHSHNPPIPFIRADVRGVFGSVFCDFGPSFTVTDLDGALQ
eukprot:5148528-Pyramimonas_sp.AAC.1